MFNIVIPLEQCYLPLFTLSGAASPFETLRVYNTWKLPIQYKKYRTTLSLAYLYQHSDFSDNLQINMCNYKDELSNNKSIGMLWLVSNS